MSADERLSILQHMTASVEAAMAAAQEALKTDEITDYLDLATLALRGIHVVHWRPLGLLRPVCPACGSVDAWYQQVDSGCVRCRCALGA
jgi:hypothetical protein